MDVKWREPAWYRKTDGTGWIPVKFSSISYGSAISQLPIDPVNTTSSGKYYEYETDGTTWKAAASPESAKYAPQATAFAQGNNMNLLGGYPNNGWVSVPGNSAFEDTVVVRICRNCGQHDLGFDNLCHSHQHLELSDNVGFRPVQISAEYLGQFANDGGRNH